MNGVKENPWKVSRRDLNVCVRVVFVRGCARVCVLGAKSSTKFDEWIVGSRGKVGDEKEAKNNIATLYISRISSVFYFSARLVTRFLSATFTSLCFFFSISLFYLSLYLCLSIAIRLFTSLLAWFLKHVAEAIAAWFFFLFLNFNHCAHGLLYPLTPSGNLFVKSAYRFSSIY